VLTVSLETNAPYPNRIQLLLGTGIQGPLVTTTRAFNPTIDMPCYVNGVVIPILSWSFDSVNNRYLLYTQQIFDPTAVVQAVHHMPSPPFSGTAVAGYGDGGYGDPSYGDITSTAPSPVLGGFSLVASYSTTGDVPPVATPGSATLTASIYPASPIAESSFLVLFEAQSIAFVQAYLPGTGGYGDGDYGDGGYGDGQIGAYTSALISTSNQTLGIISIPGAAAGSYQLVLYAFNADGTPVMQDTTQLTVTVSFNIVNP
jgi:hypothetical protein